VGEGSPAGLHFKQFFITIGLEVCACDVPKGSTEVRTLIYELLQQHQVPHVVELIEKQHRYRKNSATSTHSLSSPDSLQPGWMRPR